jgi:hypothetical protein
MSARIDQEVKEHLDAMPRDYLTRERVEFSTSAATRAVKLLPLDFFVSEETALEFEREEILQPRRLSLRVF